MTGRARTSRRREGGQVVVIFALLLPVFLALSGVVIGVGNWYVHGKNLQTKADAGAFAGGDSWEFPCGPQIDARIAAAARLYAGSSNPQVGGVPDSSIHTVLNGSDYYDDDSNRTPTEFNSPANPSVCASMTLDVKVTEDNSFPLASLIPLFPDIKRKAKVEIQQTEGISGLLPIAVRAPVPVSAAAIFYDESNGNILRVRYLVSDQKQGVTVPGLPGGLQGWTTLNPDEPTTWASLTPSSRTGVVIATSFRGACNTSLPAGNPTSQNIQTGPAPCFEDAGFATVNQLCNQGSGTQIVNCYYTDPNSSWPTDQVRSGLLFIRGYAGAPAVAQGANPPELRTVYLDTQTPTTNCGVGFTARIGVDCTAILHATLDIGSFPSGTPPAETRLASNVRVTYRIVSDTGTYCAFNDNNNCSLDVTGGPGVVNLTSTNDIPNFDESSLRNSIAFRVQFRNTRIGGQNCSGFGSNSACEWWFTGASATPLSSAPTDAQILAAPLQRYFMGNSSASSSVQWLQLTTDPSCDGVPFLQNGDDNMSVRNDTGPSCFLVDVGLKGGIAKDADEQPFLFNDGIGPSQMGSLDCDPAIPQGQILIDGVVQGCGASGWPIYGKNLFNTSPLCPQQNAIFTQPNPGAPWDSSYPWPPLRCIKTRPTGSMSQIERGLKLRFYGNQNQNSCPADAAGYVRGRNYWDQSTNALNLKYYGYKDDDAPTPRDTRFALNDRRIVTIFLTTTEAFAGSGQNTYPIVGFIEVYITGFGRVSGNGNINQDDPCGTAPPTDLDQSGGSSSGYAVWGHLIKYAIPSPGATPSGVLCDPNAVDPCVPALVE